MPEAKPAQNLVERTRLAFGLALVPEIDTEFALGRAVVGDEIGRN